MSFHAHSSDQAGKTSQESGELHYSRTKRYNLELIKNGANLRNEIIISPERSLTSCDPEALMSEFF